MKTEDVSGRPVRYTPFLPMWAGNIVGYEKPGANLLLICERAIFYVSSEGDVYPLRIFHLPNVAAHQEEEG